VSQSETSHVVTNIFYWLPGEDFHVPRVFEIFAVELAECVIEKMKTWQAVPSPGGEGQVEGERHHPKQNIRTVLATENAENTKFF
jgi:hypothetical protein